MSNKTQTKVAAKEQSKYVQVFRLVPQIEKLLQEMDQPVNKQNPSTISQMKIKLKGLCQEWYTLVQQLLIENQSGIANGFKADAFGVLSANTDFSSPEVIKKFSHAVLVNQFLKEIIEEEKVLVEQQNLPVNPTDLLLECSDTSKAAVDVNLTNGDKISFDKATGDTTVTSTDGKVHVFKKFFGGIKEMTKKIWNWFIEQCSNLKAWFKEKLFSKPKDSEVIPESEIDKILNQRTEDVTQGDSVPEPVTA